MFRTKCDARDGHVNLPFIQAGPTENVNGPGTTSPRRSVLTLAVGPAVYLQMAVNLARSFRAWHTDERIQFHIITDYHGTLPPDLDFVQIRRIKVGEFGTGFSPKLYLDKLGATEETLFIDGDCLCVRDLAPVFDRFQGRDVGVIGNCCSSGEHFGDIADRCRRFGVRWLPVFVGGLYFVRKTETAQKVFDVARRCETNYDENGFVRLRGTPNEEPLIAVGMAIWNQVPLEDDGTLKADAMLYHNCAALNVFRGIARLTGGGRKPSPTWPLRSPPTAMPAVVHFNASFAEHPPYTSQAEILRRVFADGWPIWLATVYARTMFSTPFVLRQFMKTMFRPVYRSIFGKRAIKPSRRVRRSDVSV